MLIDGEPRDLISARDRGLQYGDGLFETIAVREGRPCLWTRHLARLEAGCHRLGMPMPDPDRLATEAAAEIGGAAQATLKLILTRGQGPRGYRAPRPATPVRLLECTAPPAFPDAWSSKGIRVRWCETRLSRNPRTAGLKHLNRLEQVLARSEWSDPRIAEGLMLDTEGRVVEGTMSNLFMVAQGRLFTPELSESGVAGVMRALVIDTARDLGLPLSVEKLMPVDLKGADALFMTNALVGIWPVCELQGEPLDAGAAPPELLGIVRARAALS